MTVHPLRVTSRLQSPASAPVQLGAPEFTAVQFAAAREVAFSRAFPRTGAHCNALPRHGNFPFAKVGVEGSNPFARSNFPNQRSVRRPRFPRVLGCVLLPRPEVPRRPRKARGYLRVTSSGATAELKSWCPGNALEHKGVRSRASIDPIVGPAEPTAWLPLSISTRPESLLEHSRASRHP